MIYKSEQLVYKHQYQMADFNAITEKRTIMEFLNGIPFEELKKLVNFQSLDFENDAEWNDPTKVDELHQLKCQNALKYNCEINIK